MKTKKTKAKKIGKLVKIKSFVCRKSTTRVLIFAIAVVGSFFLGSFWGKRSTLKNGIAGAETAVEFSANKSGKPNIKFFVMSHCPYGNQAENGLKPVADLLGSAVEFEPHYIFSKQTAQETRASCQPYVYSEAKCQDYISQGYFTDQASCKEKLYPSENACFEDRTGECLATANSYYCSLHGKKELNQGVREICAWNLTEDKSKWWQFVALVNRDCPLESIDQCWQEKADEAGLEKDKIQECFNTQAVEIMDKEIAVSLQFNAQSSPTVFINDLPYPPEGAYANEGSRLKIDKKTFTPDQYRAPEVIKQAVCASFNKAPKECKEKLAMENEVGSSGSCN